MRNRFVALTLFVMLSACTVNNLHYDLRVAGESLSPVKGNDNQSAYRQDKPVSVPATETDVKPTCRKVAFPDLKPAPEPPIKEIEAVDPKDRKKMYEIMLAYTEQMRQVNKDTRAKYQNAKAQYMRRCL